MWSLLGFKCGKADDSSNLFKKHKFSNQDRIRSWQYEVKINIKLKLFFQILNVLSPCGLSKKLVWGLNPMLARYFLWSHPFFGHLSLSQHLKLFKFSHIFLQLESRSGWEGQFICHQTPPRPLRIPKCHFTGQKQLV